MIPLLCEWRWETRREGISSLCNQCNRGGIAWRKDRIRDRAVSPWGSLGWEATLCCGPGKQLREGVERWVRMVWWSEEGSLPIGNSVPPHPGSR